MAAHFHRLCLAEKDYNEPMKCNNHYFRVAVFFIFTTIGHLSLSEELSNTNQPSITTIPDSSGQQSDPQTEQQSTLFDRWFDKFVDIHDKTSTHYMSMVHSLDRYFSGQEIESVSNDSYLKIDLKRTYYEAGQQDNSVSINAKIELPNTENRFKFIFSSEPEEEKTLKEKVTDTANNQGTGRENAIAGVEYALPETESKWKQSFSAGVKLRVHSVPFIRYQFGNKWQLDEAWESEFKQSFWNYSDTGIGATSKLNFGRMLTGKDYFNAETIADWHDRDNKYYYAETFSDTHRLSKNSAIRYWTSVLGESQPTSEVTNYLIGIDYRRSLYRDWLLFSVKPLLDYPRDKNWEVTPSLTFDLQIYFNE